MRAGRGAELMWRGKTPSQPGPLCAPSLSGQLAYQHQAGTRAHPGVLQSSPRPGGVTVAGLGPEG